MNLAVFVKHVPDTAEADLAIAADGISVKTDGLPFQMNEWDRFALEEAVRLKEAGGGSLTAFLVGPEEAEESLRRCLAVGADRAVRVWDPSLPSRGPAAVADVLAAAVGEESFDLCLTGAQADDDGYGIVGPTLAALLGAPCATLVTKVEVTDDVLRCQRELEAGWLEVVELDLPALVTVQTGINEPRYVSILGIRKARKKPIDTLAAGTLAGPGLGALDDLLTVEELQLPPVGRSAELLQGSADETARQLAALLRDKGGVL